MTRPRGKAVALWSFVLGTAVLIAGGVILKDHILEPYWLWKLDSDDIEEQEAAVTKLTELGRLRPVLEAIAPATEGRSGNAPVESAMTFDVYEVGDLLQRAG